MAEEVNTSEIIKPGNLGELMANREAVLKIAEERKDKTGDDLLLGPIGGDNKSSLGEQHAMHHENVEESDVLSLQVHYLEDLHFRLYRKKLPSLGGNEPDYLNEHPEIVEQAEQEASETPLEEVKENIKNDLMYFNETCERGFSRRNSASSLDEIDTLYRNMRMEAALRSLIGELMFISSTNVQNEK